MSPRPLRHALEVRHKSFITPDFFDLLRQHNIAFVFADSARKFPYAEDLTADLVYIRLHGATKLYVSGYNDKVLGWANRIKLWRRSNRRAVPKRLPMPKLGPNTLTFSFTSTTTPRSTLPSTHSDWQRGSE